MIGAGVSLLLSVGTDALMRALGSLAGAIAAWNQIPALGPKWYPITLVAVALPQAWAGAKLRCSNRATEPPIHLPCCRRAHRARTAVPVSV